ncbi:hypothetical protein LWI29_004430 [Acer saccharum]|uniref:F-box domain-containing protein n=1 Tax=Acer saccharum TaxID=4024 RepID=A0AA39S2X4_ACESA|nr:hypothetical protein LWI29_004430 [Acer saccharum]
MDHKRHEDLIRGEDIISKLPDDILIHILSLLETKDAVKTCILSTRWRNLWTLIYNLSFNDFETNDFVNFVDKVLSCCQSKDIHNFPLDCSDIEDSDLSRVSSWICFAVDHGVRNLTIKVDIVEAWHGWPFDMPQSILTCKTLVKLRLESLHNDFFLDIPDFKCFPSLKILHISIAFPDASLMQKLFSSCPVLEDLSIHASYLYLGYLLMFDICVPTLKRLNIRHDVDFSDFEGISEHKYVITARNLEYLCIQDGSLTSVVVNERPLLNEVNLNVGVYSLLIDDHEFEVSRDEANRVMELLRGINLTKILSLASCSMDALGLAFDDDMPTFPNLIRLELNIEARFGWKLLPYFLESSPNLEVLILEMDYLLTEYIPEDFVNFESKNVPSCLKLHVKTIEIKNMMGEEDELQVVSYMLRNCVVLKEFNAHISDKAESKEDLWREILMYPRGSAACEIKFL